MNYPDLWQHIIYELSVEYKIRDVVIAKLSNNSPFTKYIPGVRVMLKQGCIFTCKMKMTLGHLEHQLCIEPVSMWMQVNGAGRDHHGGMVGIFSWPYGPSRVTWTGSLHCPEVCKRAKESISSLKARIPTLSVGSAWLVKKMGKKICSLRFPLSEIIPNEISQKLEKDPTWKCSS